MYPGGHGAEIELIRLYFTGQGHGHIGPAVECAGKGDDFRPAGKSPGQFYRVFVGFSPGVDQHGFLGKIAWHQSIQLLGQQSILFVQYDIEIDVEKFVALSFNSLDDFRNAVTDIHYTDATGKINKNVAVEIHHRTLSLFGKYR